MFERVQVVCSAGDVWGWLVAAAAELLGEVCERVLCCLGCWAVVSVDDDEAG
ncbi:hypothetical protein [Kribbella antibiotica]|uniref:hypothetical protein n=1 Tax=Kribbella antibiotica TaxID=190195 RepID=UPI0014048D18|nr:hypothetical protein [Kribbella antibiotica]